MDGVPILVGIIAMLLVAVAWSRSSIWRLSCCRNGGDPSRCSASLRCLPPGDVADRRAVGRDRGGSDADGTKTVLNEFVAYCDLANVAAGRSRRATRLILTYAMCGFANFGSLGIMIGGMTAMVPRAAARNRRRSACGRSCPGHSPPA